MIYQSTLYWWIHGGALAHQNTPDLNVSSPHLSNDAPISPQPSLHLLRCHIDSSSQSSFLLSKPAVRTAETEFKPLWCSSWNVYLQTLLLNRFLKLLIFVKAILPAPEWVGGRVKGWDKFPRPLNLNIYPLGRQTPWIRLSQVESNPKGLQE